MTHSLLALPAETRRSQALTEGQVVERYPGLFSVGLLRFWRVKGRGPRYLKIGRAVRYSPEDVEAFIRASVRTPDHAA